METSLLPAQCPDINLLKQCPAEEPDRQNGTVPVRWTFGPCPGTLMFEKKRYLPEMM